MEMSVRHEMEGLQDDTETCCDWWFGNGGPGSGRIEDAKIFTVTKTVRKEGKANISIQTLSFGPVCGFFSSVLCSATGLFPLNGSSSSPLFPLF